jgi:hypothetical protein
MHPTPLKTNEVKTVWFSLHGIEFLAVLSMISVVPGAEHSAHMPEPDELELEFFLRPTVSRPVRLGIGPPFGTLDQILACSSFV